MFKHDEMQALVAAVDERFAAAGTNNPQFAGKKVLLLEGTLGPDAVHVATPGWRSEFLTQMGFAVADTGGASIPRDRMPACSIPPMS